MRPTDPRSSAPASPMRRLASLAASILAGGIIATVGAALSDNQAWFLAIPAALAVGWLFIADPTRCDPPSRR